MSKLFGDVDEDSCPQDFNLDVVGIGALNLDYIANASMLAEQNSLRSMTTKMSDLLAQNGPPLEWGIERRVDDQTIYAGIELVSSSSVQPDTALGGSAFNTIYAIAHTQVGLRLGYVGVAGKVPVTGLSSVQVMRSLGIDHKFVHQDDEHLCGICFSYVEDGDRTLLTHVGANEYMANYLDREFDHITEYLARSRVVHVTSFIDERTAGRLLAVLKAVKAISPKTVICFDPGHVWSTEATPDVVELVRMSDYLLVNYREFRELSRSGAEHSDEECAKRLLNLFYSDKGAVIVKRSTGIWSYHTEDGMVVGNFYPQVTLPTEEVVDATGAGDVFAAGLLIVLTSDRLQIELGSLLGMRLARHKLRYVGSAGHAQFAEVTREFISRLDR